jgi:hypothetical protein
MPSDVVLEEQQELIEVQPTATPQVIYVVVTATPVATATLAPVAVLYPTRKGPRAEEDLRAELSGAGYGGPWDVTAMLAAYDRATVPTPTPTATPNPTLLLCQGVPEVVRSLETAAENVTRAEAVSDYRSLRVIASNLRGGTYPQVTLPMVNAFIRGLDWDANATELRANWTLMSVIANSTRNGYLLVAAAQVDLNRADGEVRLATLDFKAAIRELAATCGTQSR